MVYRGRARPGDVMDIFQVVLKVVFKSMTYLNENDIVAVTNNMLW
jgi:hypothetical protein